MGRWIAIALGLGLPLSAPSAASADELEHARAFLLGEELGALSNPAVLREEAHVQGLCESLQDPRRPAELKEKGELPLSKADRIERYRRVRSAVYSVYVEPARFKLQPYRFDEKLLPLDVDRTMSAIDGALSLSVMDRRGARFELNPKEARALRKLHESGDLGLKIIFRLDAGSPGPCYSYQKSEVYSLRVRPLRYALVDRRASKGQEVTLAKAHTPTFSRLRQRLSPGAAELQISVTPVSGDINEREVVDAVLGNRGAIEACMAPIKNSSIDTGVVAVGLSLGALGEVANAKIVMASQSADAVSRCVLDGLRGLRVRGARSGEVQVLVSVDRS